MTDKPTCIQSSEHYGLNLFPDNEDIGALTFKDFRQWLAGVGEGSNKSTIQQIDALFYQMAENIIAAQKNAEEKGKQLNNEIRHDLIDTDEDKTRLYVNPTEGRPIEFNDGTQISTLENGTFTIGGIKTENIDLGNYEIKHVKDNDHLQISYKSLVGGDA